MFTLAEIKEQHTGHCRSDDYSPLLTASIKGHSEVVKALLEARANVNQGDKVGTPAESLYYIHTIM